MTGSTDFWSGNQPGFRFTDAEPGTKEFFSDIERHRYAVEPHIPEVVEFERWADKDVLDVGCGVATDGVRFARTGSRYTGVDASDQALGLARRRFELESLKGSFASAPATKLPFPDRSFDLVYSHGVVHHIPEPQRAIDEFYRVLRPGGTALVMLYHRRSLNYRLTILVVRRIFAGLLLVPGATAVIARATGERPEVVEGHRMLLRHYGLRYLIDRQLFLSNNTDGPGNPLSRVYSCAEARRHFAKFGAVQCSVRFLNLRLYPGLRRLEGTAAGRALERRIGWHLYVRAFKGS